MSKVVFHLAFPVTNIAQTKDFYVAGLGCTAGRENASSLILNLYENQIVAHIIPEPITPQKGIYPRHFGLIFLLEEDWENLLERATSKQLKFYQEAKRRFIDLPTEHRTFFLEDPFSNILEFKYYSSYEAIFGLTEYTQVGDTGR